MKEILVLSKPKLKINCWKYVVSWVVKENENKSKGEADEQKIQSLKLQTALVFV